MSTTAETRSVQITWEDRLPGARVAQGLSGREYLSGILSAAGAAGHRTAAVRAEIVHHGRRTPIADGRVADQDGRIYLTDRRRACS